MPDVTVCNVSNLSWFKWICKLASIMAQLLQLINQHFLYILSDTWEVLPCMRHSWEMTPQHFEFTWTIRGKGVRRSVTYHSSSLSAGTCCDFMFHLHATFLEQPLHKLPVGLGDDGRGQIRQFGLSKVLTQAVGLLHVLLMIKQRQSVSSCTLNKPEWHSR